jgi:acetyl-CoA carboxylase biotin carboxyl carrier protein
MNSLKDYGALFKELDLTELTAEENGFKLCMKRERKEESMSFSRTECASSHIADSHEEEPADDSVAPGEPVKAPLLGVFYAAAQNNRPVKEGDSVREGQVLCTIEAMKMMNDVKAPRDGVVAGVYAKEGDLVEYDQVLFVLK